MRRGIAAEPTETESNEPMTITDSLSRGTQTDDSNSTDQHSPNGTHPASPCETNGRDNGRPNAVFTAFRNLLDRLGFSPAPSANGDTETGQRGSRRRAVSEREICRYCGGWTDRHDHCPALNDGRCMP